MGKIRHYIYVCLLLFGCSANHPFNEELIATLDGYISRHPQAGVINTTMSMIDGHNLIVFNNKGNFCDKKLVDGYFVHDNKIITYYQTDSINRNPMINLDAMNKDVDSLDNLLGEKLAYENDQREVYEILTNGTIKSIPLDTVFSQRIITGNNVITNNRLNDIINRFITNRIDVTYGLNFRKVGDRVYVELISGMTYDKNQYDGYFLRDGKLVVLYGTTNAENLMDDSWIKKTDSGIPGYRYSAYGSWQFLWPRPVWLTVYSNGDIEECNMEDVFDIFN